MRIYWRRTEPISRFLLRLVDLLWSVTSKTVTFLPQVAWRLFSEVLLEEIVWRRWLGYGERPFNVLVVIGLILVLTWLLYWQFGAFALDATVGVPKTGNPPWKEALYYSLVSFTALGYGGWASEPTGWAKWVGAVQPFFGIISAVALSINLTQRMNR